MNQAVLKLYRQFNQAMAANDTNQLAELLAPSFTLTHMTGYEQPRAEWFREMDQGTMHYFSSTEEHVEMGAIADGWQVTGQNRVVAEIRGGGQYEWPLNTVLTVQKVASRWQIMTAVVTTY